MKPTAVVVPCLAILFATRVAALSPWKALLAPDDLKTIRVRTLKEARAIGPTAVLDFIGLVQQYNYPAEEHQITTKDGYNIALHRIPGSPLINNSMKKKIVFIQHGILASSDCWVLRGPDYDIPFLLADTGYDVWLGNIRGNVYGRSHEYLSPTNPKFWEYSFHEHSVGDLKTTIDYVLNYTNNKQVYYIGHSMATTMSYILLSELPEYNKKFQLVINLSPIAFWNHELTPVYKFLLTNSDLIRDFLRSNEIYEIGSQNLFFRTLAFSQCKEIVWQPICTAIVFLLCGNNPAQLNMTFFPYIFKHYPAGTSYQTLNHYAQNMMSQKFQAYDYGREVNLRRYHQISPTEYDFSKISAKFALFYGRGDNLATLENVEEVYKRLSNVVLYQEVPYPFFSHVDFMWGNNARNVLYDKIIELMRNY